MPDKDTVKIGIDAGCSCNDGMTRQSKPVPVPQPSALTGDTRISSLEMFKAGLWNVSVALAIILTEVTADAHLFLNIDFFHPRYSSS